MNEEPVFKPYGFKKEKLVSLMKENEIRGVLLSSSENVYYTTCYTVLPSSGNPILYSLRNRLPYFVFISDDGEVTLFCWDFSTQGVEFGVDRIKGFANFAGAVSSLQAHLAENLDSDSRLGIESTCPYYVLQLIEDKVKPASLFVVDGLMSQLRLVKSEAELELVKQSTAIIETTLSELYDLVHMGMSRLELMQAAKSLLYKNGATGISHLTFSFGEANPEIAIGEKLRENKLVTLDLGGIYKGYVSDNRRYMYTGDIPMSLLEHYNLMVEIVDSVGAQLVPGTKYSQVFRHALELFEKHAVVPAKEVTHVGHNMGLETEEEWITDDPDLRVEKGMVINIELYSAAPTGEYIGDEETYTVGESGPTRLSLLPRKIRTVNHTA